MGAGAADSQTAVVRRKFRRSANKRRLKQNQRETFGEDSVSYLPEKVEESLNDHKEVGFCILGCRKVSTI